MSDCCPTCGAKLAEEQVNYDHENRTFVANGRAVILTCGEAEILNVLWSTKNKTIADIDQFASLVYADRLDGGPDSRNNINVHLVRIRRRLAPVGWTVTSNKGRPRQGWRLTKFAEAN